MKNSFGIGGVLMILDGPLLEFSVHTAWPGLVSG